MIPTQNYKNGKNFMEITAKASVSNDAKYCDSGETSGANTRCWHWRYWSKCDIYGKITEKDQPHCDLFKEFLTLDKERAKKCDKCVAACKEARQ